MAFLHDVKNALFRRIHDSIDRLFGFIAHLGNIAGHTNQLAQYGFFLHNSGIMPDIDRTAYRAGNGRQKRQTTNLFEHAFFFQFIFHRYHVNRRTSMIKLCRRFKHHTMVRAVEVRA